MSAIVWKQGTAEDFDTVLTDEEGALIGDAYERAELHIHLKTRCHKIEGAAGTFTVQYWDEKERLRKTVTGPGWSFPIDAASMADVPAGQWPLEMWVFDARGPHCAFEDSQIIVKGSC